MTQRIHGVYLIGQFAVLVTHPRPAFFVTLGLPDDEAHELHMRYYKEYGLALRGLMEHHDIGV